MERTELVVWEGANRLTAGRNSSLRPDSDSRRVPDDRMLSKGTSLMRCAPFPTFNSFLSNAAELRRPVTPRIWVSHGEPKFDDKG
jgi:hypothetical protein